MNRIAAETAKASCTVKGSIQKGNKGRCCFELFGFDFIIDEAGRGQSVSQPASQSVSQPASQSVSQSASQSASQPASQPVSQSVVHMACHGELKSPNSLRAGARHRARVSRVRSGVRSDAEDIRRADRQAPGEKTSANISANIAPIAKHQAIKAHDRRD